MHQCPTFTIFYHLVQLKHYFSLTSLNWTYTGCFIYIIKCYIFSVSGEKTHACTHTCTHTHAQLVSIYLVSIWSLMRVSISTTDTRAHLKIFVTLWVSSRQEDDHFSITSCLLEGSCYWPVPLLPIFGDMCTNECSRLI